jgi:hypothetical protein
MTNIKPKIWCLLVLSFLLTTSCVFQKGKVVIGAPNRPAGPISVSKVEFVNHQLIITGANLKNVYNLKVEGNAFNETFSIESKSANQIVANSLKSVSFGVGSLFNLILSDARAAATFQIDFSLCNASLNGKGFNCSVAANNNDVLTYVAATGKWTPKPLVLNGLVYVSAYDASTTVYPTGAVAGEYWIINVAGTINAISYKIETG